MTRLLHQLLDDASRHAPDESHSVAEIVHGAQRRHRLRATAVVAGSIASALAVAGLGYAGVRAIDGEDADPVRPTGKVVQFSDARMAAAGVDYELLSTHTSSADLGKGTDEPLIRYVTPLDNGRGVLVREAESASLGRFGVLHPGSDEIEWLRPPPADRSAAPYHVDDATQVWASPIGLAVGGNATVQVVDVGTGWTSLQLSDERMGEFWLFGDRLWFSTIEGHNPGSPMALHSVPIDGSEEPRREVEAALGAVAGERGTDARHVAWFTHPLQGSPGLVVRDVETGKDTKVPIDLAPGFGLGPVSPVVAGDRVGYWSFAEGEDGLVTGRLTVTSFDGEALVSIDGADQVRMSETALWLLGPEGVGTYVYPFDTGELLRLSQAPPSTYDGTIRDAYLSWSSEESGRSRNYFARLL